MDPLDPAATSSPRPAPPTRRRRSCLGFLFTSGLGCASFLVGCLFAAALFGPSFLAGPMVGWVSRFMSDNLDGRVVVRELDLAWDRQQKASGVELFDPEGRRVALLEVVFPSLLTVLFDSKREDWHVEVRVLEGDLRIEPGGTTNVGRALAHEGSLWGRRRGHVQLDEFDSQDGLDQAFRYSLELRGNDLRLLVGEEEQPSAVLEAFELRLQHVPGGAAELALSARPRVDAVGGSLTGSIKGQLSVERAFGGPLGAAAGRVEWSGVPTAFLEVLTRRPLADALGAVSDGELGLGQEGPATGVTLASGATLAVRVGTTEDPLVLAEARGRGARWAELGGVLAVERCPTVLLERVLGLEGWLADVFGPTLALECASPTGDEGVPFTLTGLERSARWSGRLVGGEVRGAGAGERLVAQLSLPAVRSRVLTTLVPWLEVLAVSDAPGTVPGTPRLELADYRLPLDGALDSLRADLRLSLGGVRYRLSESMSFFHGQDGARAETEAVLPAFWLGVEHGRVTYRDLELVIGGEECLFQGSLDLVTRELSLRSEVPPRYALPWLRMDVPEESLDFMIPVVIAGTDDEPVLNADITVVGDMMRMLEELKSKLLGKDGE